MLYVQDKVVKLGGVLLGGEVTSVEISEAGSVYTAQDEKGRYTKSQPVGYENGKVNITILLEDMGGYDTLQQLAQMQHLFKAYGQEVPELLPIVNEDCSARGITEVYFKTLTSKKTISESKRIATLELWCPDITGITVTKRKSYTTATVVAIKKYTSLKNRSKTPAMDSRDTIYGKKIIKRMMM